jgi:hypothetical protein
MFFSVFLIVNVCSAGQVSGAGEDETRPTSRVSQSPLSAPLARSTNPQKARLCLCKQTPPLISPHTIKTIRRANATNKSGGRHKTSAGIFGEKHAFGLSQ